MSDHPDPVAGTARVNGIELHFEIGGDGPPLLLISGLGQHSGAWAGVLPRLRQRFRTLVFDNRGTGRSAVPPGPYPIDAMADDAAALLEHLGIPVTAAVGWSLGGSVLQSMLIRHGRRLSAAVLLNAFPSYTELQHIWLDALIALRRSDASPEAKAAFAMPWGLTPLGLADHALAMQGVRAAAADPYPTSHAAFEAQAAGLRVYDARPGLPTVKTPTLVLAGAEDVLTPVAQSAEIASLIPGARLHVMGKGGHRMIVEYPDEVLRLIDGFVR
ncbi:alpha/beta fold hydrolase [Chelatococcus reniformis]|uniref:Alpha/beta hydrolase fold protein n=1 Tax=Chelatococcus reniformis TaxID=1494448 RepID=A0A916UGS0_9HYPH|nr:alpha/beta fold hydrolase [Chelatococcus reniformis]GGC72320.1 alpha/beta hydrolase fold protein [Chelatococcus reniformis]